MKMKINSKKIKSLFLLGLVGSGATRQASNNQTGVLNDNQLSEMATNLTKREDTPDPRVLFAGYPIIVENTKKCTAAFIGDKQGIDGFITSAQCCARNNCNLFPNQPLDNVYGYDNDGNLALIGGAYDIRFGDNGLEYLFVTSILVDWNNILYTAGLTSDDGTISEVYPATSYLTLTEADKGKEICTYGAKSGYRCGTLNEVDVEITIPNP
jgi:hypothetical protein